MISIVIPIATIGRTVNLEQCIKCIVAEDVEHEIIIVEQSLNGFFYYQNTPHRWCGIKDNANRGYNLSWGRNVGARLAHGETIVLMDCDFIFDRGYLKKIAEFKGLFACGARRYTWGTQKNTEEFFRTKNIRVFDQNEHKLPAFGKIVGYGCVLIFNREWYLNTFGGYNENFFKYGHEDHEGAWRIKHLLKKTDEEIDKIDHNVIHLWHTHDISGTETNRVLCETIKRLPPQLVCNRLIAAGVGDRTTPRLI